MEGDQPLQERPRNMPRQKTIVNKLLLISSMVQWIGLFLCLIYVFNISQYITVNSQMTKCQIEEKKGFTLRSSVEFGSIKVQDNSLKIRCDGFYLLNLRGFLSRTPQIDFCYRDNICFKLFSNFSSYQYISSVAVVYLRAEDLIYQKVEGNKSCENIVINSVELSLIQLTNDDFCSE
uniref:TNF family profile domain-containing protein n=1 Tax=Monodelphis domestica TaxID=13616 RepID=A0A5F8GA94_MONDO